jgi:hypothetical protein
MMASEALARLAQLAAESDQLAGARQATEAVFSDRLRRRLTGERPALAAAVDAAEQAHADRRAEYDGPASALERVTGELAEVRRRLAETQLSGEDAPLDERLSTRTARAVLSEECDLLTKRVAVLNSEVMEAAIRNGQAGDDVDRAREQLAELDATIAAPFSTAQGQRSAEYLQAQLMTGTYWAGEYGTPHPEKAAPVADYSYIGADGNRITVRQGADGTAIVTIGEPNAEELAATAPRGQGDTRSAEQVMGAIRHRTYGANRAVTNPGLPGLHQ